MLREKPHDRVRKSVTCPTCGKLLCKIDQDGTIHVKPYKGAEMIIEAGARVMFKCEPVSFLSTDNPNDPRIKASPTPPSQTRNGKTIFGIRCGSKTLIAEGCHA